MSGQTGPRVRIPQSVADRFTAEIQAHPRVEVGGKYVGFIHGVARSETLDERIHALHNATFDVTDFLPDGPKAQRTPSFHLGDAEWQTAEFRKLEAANPDIEQLGSWHSHHPNRLAELSGGDIRGYQETVDDPGHNHDFFFVSLGIDLAGFATARHYIFVRGCAPHIELSPSAIEIIHDRPAQKRVEPPVDEHVPHMAKSVPGWSDSTAGVKALRAEYSRLATPEFAQMKLGVADGRLIATGWVLTPVGRVSVSLVYPTAVHQQDGLLKLAIPNEAVNDVTLTAGFATGFGNVEKAVALFINYVLDHRRQNDSISDWLRRFVGKKILLPW